MSNAIVMRSASTSAAALLVGALLFSALTMQFRYFAPPAPPAPPRILVQEIKPDEPLREPMRRSAEPRRDDVVVEAPSPEPLADAAAEVTDIPTAPAPPSPLEVLHPRWLERPDNLARYYPRRAIMREVEGLVILDCVVRVTGALDCAIASEAPPRWGFGEAALRIARDHRMVPAMRDGAPVEARYRMRVPFELG